MGKPHALHTKGGLGKWLVALGLILALLALVQPQGGAHVSTQPAVVDGDDVKTGTGG